MIHSPIQQYLESLHARMRGLTDGAVADYIPELAAVDPDSFGICVATRDGHIYEIGDTRLPLTIQSVSKPMTYGLALEQNGRAAVLAKIGVEPSGDAFNAISLQPETGRPINPLINAGAIATCGMIDGASADEKTAHILEAFSRYAGRALDIDQKVYLSESATGHRNRAIGWMLHNFSIIHEQPNPTLEAYFQQCAIRIDCRDLALMGATLANGGVNPITGVRALASEYVGNVLSVMTTCGMYDASGDWLYQTGLPAKSGVGGGVLAVQPGRLAIAVFSLRLDAQGNSVRGVAVCRAIAEDLRLHVLDGSDRVISPVRRSLTRRMAASKMRRSEAASEHLNRVGERVRLYHLHGVLVFASVEEIIRRMLERAQESDLFILNFKLVQGINLPSLRLLARTQAAFQQVSKHLLFTEASTWWQSLIDVQADSQSFFADDDFALEFAENTLLAEWQTSHEQTDQHRLSDCDLFKGFSAEDLSQVEQVLVSRTNYQGQTMVAVGQASDELFVIMSGEAMVSAPTASGLARLDVFSVGCTFGEVAFIDRSPRSANVTALGLVECKILTRMAFEKLAESAPQLRYKIMESIAFGLAGTVRQINRDLALLK